MSFKDMLKSDESLIRDDVPLSYDFQPKILRYREQEQRQFAYAIKPLLQERSGRNLFVYGAPGVGKTVACRHVLRELEDETDTIIPVYINCWKNNTAYKMVVYLCSQLGITFITNQKTAELFSRAVQIINKKKAVFVFDEIDKLEDFDMLYMVLEEVYRKAIFLITNYKDKVRELDERIMSRLTPELIEFKPYNKEEIRGIITERMKYAFVPGVWDNATFSTIIEKTSSLGDLRKGLFLMREAANLAEEKSQRKITLSEVKTAIAKLDESVSVPQELDNDLKKIIEAVKKKPAQKMGDLFRQFISAGGETSYKSFTRKIDKLNDLKLISLQRVSLGNEGNTTLVYPYSEKKLTDY